MSAIIDPLRRRYAGSLQALFLFMAAMLPANWIYHYLAMGMPAVRGGTVLLAADMSTAAVALAAFFLARRGLLRTAVIGFLAAMLIGIAVSAMAIGFQALMFDQTYAVLSLIVGGLVLGRAALWTIFASLLLIFGAGMLADAHHLAMAGKPAHLAFGNAPSVVLSYLVIAVVIDRCARALLDTLKELEARGKLLEMETARRERAQSQLIHAQKMEAVGRVAGGIAHDFDNILSVIHGYAAARERLAGQGIRALMEALEGVEHATRRAMKISRRLLTFSRDDAGDLERFDAGIALADLLPMLRRLCGERVSVELSMADGALLPIRMDRSRFDLMLLNLAANARDAMPRGGRLRVAAFRDGERPSVGLSVEDDGDGIDPEVLEHIFKPFYTTKPSGRGTGLGLDVVHRLMTECGGAIEVQSTPGSGSRFTLRIPLDRA